MRRKTYAALPNELNASRSSRRVAQIRIPHQRTRRGDHAVGPGRIPGRRDRRSSTAADGKRSSISEASRRSCKWITCGQDASPRANEFFIHLVAYNLIRRLMAVSAQEKGTQPWQLSFKGTLQMVNASCPFAPQVSPEQWCTALAAAIATHTVGDRPDRYEPRVKKRRCKEYDLMNKPRAEYKRQMAK